MLAAAGGSVRARVDRRLSILSGRRSSSSRLLALGLSVDRKRRRGAAPPPLPRTYARVNQANQYLREGEGRDSRQGKKKARGNDVHMQEIVRRHRRWPLESSWPVARSGHQQISSARRPDPRGDFEGEKVCLSLATPAAAAAGNQLNLLPPLTWRPGPAPVFFIPARPMHARLFWGGGSGVWCLPPCLLV